MRSVQVFKDLDDKSLSVIVDYEVAGFCTRRVIVQQGDPAEAHHHEGPMRGEKRRDLALRTK